MTVLIVPWVFAAALAAFLCPSQLMAQPRPASAQIAWEKTLEAARKEGKVAISIPASAEMRKQLEENFKKRYGIEVEVFTARGSAAVRRMADEFKAGVRYFDLHIGGSSSAVSGMLDEDILDAIEPWMALPEVKDPKQWWGEHMWVDNAKRYMYMFQAYLTESIWYNTDLAKPNELRSYDDLLNPKWKGKIGLPRSANTRRGRFQLGVHVGHQRRSVLEKTGRPGSAARARSARARGKSRQRTGRGHGRADLLQLSSFHQSRLADQGAADFKEGTYGTGGSGNLAIIKSPAHPNATKVFVNWLLGREGQEIIIQGPRPGDPPVRCRYQVSARDRRDSGERSCLGERFLADREPVGRKARQGSRAGAEVRPGAAALR